MIKAVKKVIHDITIEKTDPVNVKAYLEHILNSPDVNDSQKAELSKIMEMNQKWLHFLK